jgi:hypothetical protein
MGASIGGGSKSHTQAGRWPLKHELNHERRPTDDGAKQWANLAGRRRVTSSRAAAGALVGQPRQQLQQVDFNLNHHHYFNLLVINLVTQALIQVVI